jgi:hypothetical protein
MLDLIFSGLVTLLGGALDGLIQLFLPILDFNFDTFNSTFPYAADAYIIIQYIGMAVALLIATFRIIPFFFGGEKSENPFRVLVSAGIAVACVFYGNYGFSALMEFAQMPFDALRVSHTAVGFGFNISHFITQKIGEPALILNCIILIAIIIAFGKLFIEIIERYVFLFVLLYLSPLFSSTLASKETSGIFKKFVSMFISQCIIFVLNIWFLKMVISMFQNLTAAPAVFLALLMGYAMLRIAAKIDNYLNQLGLNSALAGMGSELAVAGIIVSKALGGKMPNGNKGSGNNRNNSSVLGSFSNFTNGIIDGIKKHDPFGPFAGTARQALVNALHGKSTNWGEVWEEQKANNVFWRHGKVAQNIGDMKNIMAGNAQKPETWANQMGTVSRNGYMADQIFSQFASGDAECKDSLAISSVAQGIGINAIDEDAGELLNVGYGNVNADNSAFSMNNQGIHAEYEKDGWKHEWDIKNASQFNELTPQKQQAYEAFKSSDGKQYYMSYNKTRAESAAMKSQTAAMEQIKNFGLNPLQHQLDSNAMAMLRKDPAMVHDLYQNLGKNGVSFDTSTAEGRRAMADMLSITPVSGSAFAGKKAAMDALAGGATITASSCNANGMELSWKDPQDNTYAFAVKTPAGVADAATLMNSGYTSFDMGKGSFGWANYTTPPAPKEVIATKAKNFASDPNTSPLSSGDCQTIFKDPGMAHSVLMGIGRNGGKIHIEPGENSPYREYAAGMVANLRLEGVPASERNAAAMAIMAGQARFDQDGRGFSVEYDASANEGRQITMLTPSAIKGTSAPDVGGERLDYDQLANRRYSINTINGDNFYSLYETQLPPTRKANRSTNDHY